MPVSIDPPPKDDEIECARCGAYLYYELTHCSECGVNIYEPDEEADVDYRKTFGDAAKQSNGLLDKMRGFFRRLSGKPYLAEEVFGNALDQALLYDDLLRKVGGDQAVVERLIKLEEKEALYGTRTIWIKNAILRWERDNRVRGYSQLG
jgi:hypothetical protein